jgi:hypothetical protein
MFRKLVLYSLYSLALAGTFASLSAGLAACTRQSDLTPIFTPAPTKTVTPTFTPTLDFLHMDRIPGLDPLALSGGAGRPGEKLSLPQDVFSAARERHLAPIEAEGSIAAAFDQASCRVMLTDHLVNGAELQEPPTDGKVIYSLDGQAGSEALFRFSGLPEGVRATAFVAQEGNPWGFKAGTVVVWFWEGGGKGPAQILNLDNPLRIMADSPNSIQISSLDNGLIVTTTDAGGTVIDEQRVVFLPPEAPIFTPEGFQISELGLLQNPETGRNVLVMNPEADWERVREEIIGGLWQANIDWWRFAGQSSDALNYSQEEFIKAALEGKTLKIGIPVRDHPDWDNWGGRDDPHSYYNVIYKTDRQTLLRLKSVNVRLDDIQLQVLDPVHFKEFMGGRDWLDLEQEAISQGIMPSDKGNGAIAFTVSDNGELVITTGSYDFRDIPIPDNPNLTIGRFDDSLHDNYHNFFREDGLGVTADKAASYYIGVITEWLNHLPQAEKKTYYREMKNGIAYKYILVPLALPDDIRIDLDKRYTSLPLFIFTR